MSLLHTIDKMFVIFLHTEIPEDASTLHGVHLIQPQMEPNDQDFMWLYYKNCTESKGHVF